MELEGNKRLFVKGQSQIQIFFPDANTGQWSVSVLVLEFASVRVQGSGCRE